MAVQGRSTTIYNVKFEDIGALENVKKELREAISFVKEKRRFNNKGIILFGPSGCGKTLLSKALRTECEESGINFISLMGPALLSSMYLKEDNLIEKCFDEAKKKKTTIILVDELDVVYRQKAVNTVVKKAIGDSLLKEIDRQEDNIMFVGICDKLRDIETSLLRPGRLERIIFVPLPSEADRFSILKSLTENKLKVSNTINLERISSDSRCQDFSGFDLKNLLRTALNEAVRERSSSSSTDKDIEINLKHFETALCKVKRFTRSFEMIHSES